MTPEHHDPPARNVAGESMASSDVDTDPSWFGAGVGGVAGASFFSDTGHEIATAILPSFITATLHASAGALGIVEGVSDSLMGPAKLGAGPLANQAHRRSRLASGGYLGTAIYLRTCVLAGVDAGLCCIR